MPPLQLGDCNLLDRSNSQNTAFSTSTPPYGSSPAALKLVDHESPQHQALHLPGQDDFTYYNDYVNPTTIPGIDTDEYAQYDDGLTGCAASFGSTGHVGSQLLDGPGSVPCNLTARLANRSNGAPLATIIEQCSHSTLNSRVSLLSVGRVPHPSCSIDSSTDHASQNSLRNREDKALQRIQEDTGKRQVQGDTPERRLSGTQSPTLEKVSGIHADAISPTHRPDFETRDAKQNATGKQLSAILRDVFHTVQATSRTKSWCSSMTQTITAKTKDRVVSTYGGPRSHQHEIGTAQTIRGQESIPRSTVGSILDPTSTLLGKSQTTSRQIPSTVDVRSSAPADLPLLAWPPPESRSTIDNSSVPYSLPLSIVTHSREKSTSMYPVPPPKPRDEAHSSGTSESLMLRSEDRAASPFQDTFDGVPVCSRKVASLTDYDRARNSPRNASSCSTASTSYSGAVVGIDLDLDHRFVGVHTMRRTRSSTPVALPVWFTPQMAELERQASVSESPELEQRTVVPPLSHSMRSFALPSLLPIAAASGIVTPNYNTPKISFYSPSGNLIQPESSSSPGTNSSEISRSPTSYHDHSSRPTRKAAICLPPVRPALLPRVTPPASSAPLPAHLRHHHNYRHREKSQIEPMEPSFVIPTAVVKGCGGIVKSPSYSNTPRSGTRHDRKHSRFGSYQKNRRSTRSVVHDLRYEVNFLKAGLITAAFASCGPSRKGKTPQKRHRARNRAAVDALMQGKKNDIDSGSVKPVTEMEEKGRIPTTLHEHDHGALGLLTGHILRICFCQPYDGAGEPTHVVTADSSCISGLRSGSHGSDKVRRAREITRDVDGELPNTRVVGRTSDPDDDSEKRSAFAGASGRIRTASESVVGVAVGLRVATIGA